jgi:hypothetical protein
VIVGGEPLFNGIMTMRAMRNQPVQRSAIELQKRK